MFDKYGWELVESQIPNDGWIAEIWLVKSIWSPTDCYVFLSFQVDQQLKDKTKRNFNVWSIGMSLTQPSAWREDNFNIKFHDAEYYEEVSIKRNFEKRTSEFFEKLATLRSRFDNHRK